MKKILLGTLLLSSLSQAQIYKTYEVPFNPDRIQGLGLGYDALYKNDSGIECVQKNIIDLDDTNNLGSKMSSNFVSNHRELLETMDIGMSMSADMTFAELFSAQGSFSAHYNKTFKLKEDEISFVLYLTQDYGRKAIVNPELKPQYQALLDEGKYEGFRELCGTHYYTLMQRKSYVVAMVKISGLSKETKKSFDAKYSSKLELDAFDIGGTFSASYKQLMQEVNKLAKVSVEFFAIGGDGIVKLTDVMNSSTSQDINAIVQGLTKYAETMTEDKAAPAKFKLNLYPGYPYDAVRLNFREKRLIDLLVKNSQRNMDLVTSLEADEGEVLDRYSDYAMKYLYDQIDSNEKMVMDCIATGNCDLKRPKDLDIITKEDSLRDIKVFGECSYKRHQGSEYITKLQARVKGNLYFPERVSKFELYSKQNGALKKVQLPYNLNVLLSSTTWDNFFEADTWFKRFYTPLDTLYFNENIQGIANDVKVRREAVENLLNKEYWLKIFYEDKEILNKLGHVDLTDCPIVK